MSNELKTQGVQDLRIAVTDGPKGISEALQAAFPATTLPTCIAHLVRSSLVLVSWKERKAVAAALKAIYTSVDAELAEGELDGFAQGQWGKKFPAVVAAWRRA